jgi:hypothetical protein
MKIQIKIKLLMTIAFSNGIAMEGYSDINDMVNGVINSCPLTKHINSLDFQPEEYSEQQLLKIQDILQKLNNGDKQPYLNFMKELKSPVPTELIWNFFLTLLFSILLIVIF